MRFNYHLLMCLNNKIIFFLLIAFIPGFFCSCQRQVYVMGPQDIVPVTEDKIIPVIEPEPAHVTEEIIPQMEYAIQAGAFSRLGNAVRLTESLQKLGLETYYFKDDSGLYKVRFGDFPSKDLALVRAKDLRENNTIEVFYIIGPEDYQKGKDNTLDEITALRKEIVDTAKSFIGIPYRFGGETAEEGFDCSGLIMASYRLNGLKLPRNSRRQWAAGKSIDKQNALEADLVFFDTMGKGRVSHVGIYIGNGKFIHAPKTGKSIRIDSMSNSYFKKCYLGTRTYL